MTKHLWRTPPRTVCAVLCALGAITSCRSAQPVSALEGKVTAIVDEVLRDTPTVGISVAVGRGGAVVFARGFGVADVDTRRSLTADAVMDIGSIAKQVTAAAVLKLVEQGHIDIDRPVHDYLRGWNDRARGITVRQLLNHTSGLEDPPFSEENPDRRFLAPATADDLLDQTRSAAFRFAPQETWFYANTGYQLLGLLIEHLHGKPYGRVIEEVIAHPLSLRTLVYCDKTRAIEHRVRDYILRGGKPEPIAPVDVSWFGGAGSLCASASDLVRWEQTLWTSDFLSMDMRGAMHSKAQLYAADSTLQVDYGFGRAFGIYGGHRKIGHTGSGSGISAILVHYPDDDLILAVLVNSNGGEVPHARAIEARMAAELIGLTVAPEAADVPVAAKQAAEWAGVYVGSYGPVEIKFTPCEADGLCGSLVVGPGHPRRLRHRGNGVFTGPFGAGSELRFVPAVGQAHWVVHSMHGLHDNVFRRTISIAPAN